ncbi:hypothetical protein VT06_04415 [Arsukibacterium sp. MJ3]|uniref:autotransporter assembly complex protein TamB n=1 Tax=Arsukibacterium sp. MJ3 TaxID=1632859 RepID=UPI00062746BC|nr:translocation/assembly module TamB domain-containing protein [Arsukibacterium sp. MJ3]KKO49844.1 hypothetical protein VT06_04415 [Arsukibacterium sp. MJ3]
MSQALSAQPNKKSLLKKILKWLNWALVLPLLLIMLLLVVWLYSSPGLTFSLWLGQKYVPELSVGQHSGSVLGGMQLSNVSWQDEANTLQLGQLELDINNSCFFQLKVCVSALTLSDTTVQLAQNTLHFKRFTTAIDAWGRQLQLNDSQLQQLQIELAVSEPISTEPFRYQPPVLPNITLPISVFINGFTLTEASIVQQATQTPLPEINFSLQARGQQIRLLDFQASHPLANISATAELTMQDNYPLRARISTVFIPPPFTEQQLNISLSGSLANLALTARAQGLLNATLDGNFELLAADLPLSVTLNYQPVTWPMPDLNAPLQISAGALSASGNLQQLTFELDGGIASSKLPLINLRAKGQYQLAESTLILNSYIADTLGGSFTGNGNATLAMPINWQTTLTLNTIQPGLFWPELNNEFSGELNGKLSNQGTLGKDGSWQTALTELAITGSLRDEKVNISGDVSASFAQPSGTYQFNSKQLLLQHGNNQISVSGSLAKQWQLDAKVAIADLASSVPDASGVINADITIRGEQQQPDIKATLSATDLRYADSRLAALTLDATLQLSDVIQANIALSANNGRWQEYQLEQLTVSGSGSENQHSLNLELQSTLSDITLQLNGKLTQRHRWQGQLSSADIGSPLGSWQLQQAVDVVYLPKTQLLTLSQHCWTHSISSLCLTDNASLSPEKIAAQLELQQLNLASLDAFMPLGTNLTGELHASANVLWQQGQSPFIVLDIKSNAGAVTRQTAPPISLQWQTFTFSARVKEQQLNADLQTSLNEHAQLTGTLSIADITAPQRPFNASLQLTDFTLAFLQPLLDEYSELAGVLSADITAEGSLENPLLAGQLQLQQLRVKGKLAPTDINDGALSLNFKGEQADLQGNIDTADGKLTLKGQADWQQLDDWRANLAIVGDQLKIQIPQGRINIKPDINISASPKLTKVTGDITIPSAKLSIDALPQNAIGVSNDTVILNTKGQPVAEQQAMAIPVEANIRVMLGDKVALDAFGLQTLLRGSLQVQQRKNRQTVNGEVRLIDGTFRSYGQDLLIRKGKMNFSGPPDQPYLNIEAIRNPANMEDSVVAGIRVIGPADRPQITIFSEPAMPQANALSYLLVGRDLDSESGSAANAVTTSLIGMSIASSGSLVGEIGEAFGVRDLTLDTAGAGDSSQVTVSGYLNRDLQIKYGIGIFEPIGVFTLRYRLMQSLYLEAVSGLDNAVDLLYRFEFD